MNDFSGFCQVKFLEDCLKLPVPSGNKEVFKVVQETPKPKFKLWSEVKVKWEVEEDIGDDSALVAKQSKGIIVGYVWSPKHWLIASTFIYTVCLEDGCQEEFPEYEILD